MGAQLSFPTRKPKKQTIADKGADAQDDDVITSGANAGQKDRLHRLIDQFNHGVLLDIDRSATASTLVGYDVDGCFHGDATGYLESVRKRRSVARTERIDLCACFDRDINGVVVRYADVRLRISTTSFGHVEIPVGQAFGAPALREALAKSVDTARRVTLMPKGNVGLNSNTWTGDRLQECVTTLPDVG